VKTGVSPSSTWRHGYHAVKTHNNESKTSTH